MTNRSAILFYGQPRFFKQGYEYLYPNLIKPNEPVDIFMHHWYDPSKINQPYDASPWNTSLADIPQPDTIANLTSLYQPISIISEPQIDFSSDTKYNTMGSLTPPYILFSMNFSRKKVCELKQTYEKEHDFKYDWVAITRTDLALMIPITFNQSDNSNMYLFNDVRTPGEYNDGLLFSSSENMDYFSTLFDHIDEYCKSGVKMGGEALTGHHLRQGNIQITPRSMPYGFIRADRIQMGGCE